MIWKALLVLSVALLLTYWFFQDDKLDTLKGKRVLVTGSSKGIGEQIAYHYARLGASVVVTARRAEELDKVVKECQSLSTSPTAKFVSVPADMSKMSDTKRVIEAAIKSLGGLDILVLNHVTAISMAFFKGSTDDLADLQKKMDINFMSYVHLASHALSELTANEGSIIVVNSIVGKIPQVLVAAYTTSKFALNGFFSSWRNEFIAEGRNVSITSCYLGPIGTDSTLSMMKGKADNPWMAFFSTEDPNVTALKIIKGGARRVPEVYSPFSVTWPMTLFHGIWPAAIEYIVRVSGLAVAGVN